MGASTKAAFFHDVVSSKARQDTSASSNKHRALATTQAGEWWDPAAWDVTPYLTATCAAGFVECCNGFVCDDDGVTPTSTTCQAACGGACCDSSGDGSGADACVRFTGRVCRDGSCTGNAACVDTYISEIINGCQGEMACHMAAYPPGTPRRSDGSAWAPVPRVHNSCRSVSQTCLGIARDGGEVGSIINSCNANPDPTATDHTTVNWEGNLMYDRQCYHLCWKGTVGDIVDSCAGDKKICVEMGSGANSPRVGNVIRSCTSPAADTASPDTRKPGQGYSGCYILGVGGRVGDIVDSCHDDPSVGDGFSACGALAQGGTVGNIVRSCLFGQTCSLMAVSGGTVGDLYDSCTVKDSCRSMAWNQFSQPRSEVGNIIGSCNGFYSCVELGMSGAFGDILGSCLEDYSCQGLANKDDADSTDKTLSCCTTKSAVTDGTCAAASSDATLCSIGDATKLAAYCGSGSCPAGAPRPPPGPAPAPGPGPAPGPAYPSWFPPSTDGGDSSGIFLNEEKSFDGSGADGTGRYRINWQGFSGNEARTACTWYRYSMAITSRDYNFFEVGAQGEGRRFSFGQWWNNEKGWSFTTYNGARYPHTPLDEIENSPDTNWHHACVTWDGSSSPTVSSLKAYYDGQALGSFEFALPVLDTGNTFSYWGSEMGSWHFLGDQKDLVFIKGKALTLEEIQAVRSLTGPTDFCGDDKNGCSHTCNSDDGACSCPTGYTLGGDGKTCEDVDECSTDNGGCDANASCANTDGSFTCTCNSGFSGDGTSCSVSSSDLMIHIRLEGGHSLLKSNLTDTASFYLVLSRFYPTRTSTSAPTTPTAAMRTLLAKMRLPVATRARAIRATRATVTLASTLMSVPQTMEDALTSAPILVATSSAHAELVTPLTTIMPVALPFILGQNNLSLRPRQQLPRPPIP